MTAESTCIVEFIKFVELMAENLKPEFRKRGSVKPWLLMDNHSAHRSPDSAPTLSQHFTAEWQPTYSSPFNCQGK